MPARSLKNAEPNPQDIATLVSMFNQGRFAEGERLARVLIVTFPNNGFCWKVLGTMQQSQSRCTDAIESLQRAAALLPRDEQVHSNLGVALAEIHRMDEAEIQQRLAIKLKPDFAQAHFNLGTLLQAQAKLPAAEASYRRATQLNSGHANAHRNLGNILLEQNNLSEAAASYRRCLALEPTCNDVRFALANVLKDLARNGEAETEYRNALQLQEHVAEAHNNLGIVLKRLEKKNEAETSYRRALQLNPDFAEAHYNLGIHLAEQDRAADAAWHYRQALSSKPDYAAAHINLGNLLEAEQRFVEAEASHRQAIAIDPSYAAAHCNLGNSLRGQGRLSEAEASYRHALELNPRLAEASYNLGISLAEQNRLQEAEASYRDALRLRADYVDAYKNLGNTLKEQGHFAEAEACYRQALQIKPDYIDAQSNLLFDLNYTASREVAACSAEAILYGKMVQSKVVEKFKTWSAAVPDRLRVGLVSGDLHSHPVGFFLEALLSQIDASRIELIAYQAHHVHDDLTARIQPSFAKWQSLVGIKDAAAASMVHADGVHVLLDLSGHTARNRLPMFAFKPAPVQATWLGYFATTGVAEMDYCLGDPYVTPPQEENQFTEKVWRLPESYLCFTPPSVALAAAQLQVASLPALTGNGVTFGCFNNLVKMNAAVVALWARVLRALPDSRLMLKCRQLDDAATRENVRGRFAQHGISAQQLILEGNSPRAELLAAYHRVDIALDPFPYPGGTTSVEGLWMGVPVITRKGDRFLSHVGESIAHNAGLAGWVATDDESYVAKAVAAVSDLQALAALRMRLRSQVLASPLFDATRFARHFENALWGMWQRWQAQQERTE